MPEQKIIKVVVERETKDFIHPDLSNAAYHYLVRIRSREAAGDTEGLFLDRMGCLTMIAFALEAEVNFVGWKLQGENWDERLSTRDKIKLILKSTGLELDWNKRPLLTVTELISVRNDLAHGKPRIVETREELSGTYDELYALSRKAHTPDWEKFINQDFVEQANADTDQLYKALLEAAKVDIFDTLGGHSWGMTLKDTIA